MNEHKMWCVTCGTRFTEAETIGATACPHCQSRGVPCNPDHDFVLEVNWHELRILAIWAENWARRSGDEDPTMIRTVHSIARRLQNQIGGSITPLTLSEEIQLLKLHPEMEGAQSNVPDPPTLTTNGPGAVGYAKKPPPAPASAAEGE